jgi:hypothetical protein
MTVADKAWDLFISHASEDKADFVRPLALALGRLGLEVWYDEFSLKVGDSLSRSIDVGLAKSRFGVVVISPHFIEKPWPEYELRGLVARDVGEGRVILPIWHGVRREQVLAFSPPLADKVALNTRTLNAEEIALQLLLEVRPDLYERHPRAELERLARAHADEKLQKELESVRAELAEFKCPYCAAPLEARILAPADEQQDDWGLRETFECGYRAFDGSVESPCPSDPRFPRFEDYELHFHESQDRWGTRWSSYARGLTDWAKRVLLATGSGATKEEAAARIREDYDRRAKRFDA